MTQQTKVIVVIESEHDPKRVVARATWLAELSNADVDIYLCDREFGPLGAGYIISNEAKEIDRAIRNVQERLLSELAEIPRARKLKTSTHILDERPIAEAILNIVERDKPRFVVKGSQYHSDAERSIIVQSDWQLMRICPCPLWLVKKAELRDTPFMVACVDPMHRHKKSAELDDVIVASAQRLAEATNGELHLLHTYEKLTAIGKEVVKAIKPIKLKVDEIDARIKAEHRDALDKLADRHDIDADRVHQLPGPTHELLPAFVRSKKADIVVMGALSRWNLHHATIGSTAERVIDHLASDVLIVR